MKKLLLFVAAIIIFQFSGYSQNGACNTFSNATGLGEWDPNNKVSFSVANNELTIVFTNADFWGQNEVKWDFPTTLNLSASATAPVTYDIAVTSVVINGGTGAGCGTINYLPLGIALYDVVNPSSPAYSTGAATSGYWDANYASGSTNVTISPAVATSIGGISIKPASFNDATSGCNTDGGQGGSGTVTATIKIKNLKVGNATCVTSLHSSMLNISSLSVYPNPASGSANINLKLKREANVKMVVIDMMGREVLQVADGNFTEFNKEINTSLLQKGMYSVNVILDGKTSESRILVVE